MPNWTTTTLELTHTDKNMINRVKNSITTGLFKEFLPIPTPEPEDLCLWCCNNWGTKWDAQDVQIVDDSTNSIKLIFNTAWSPPESFFYKIYDMDFEVFAEWSDEDCEDEEFAGEFYDGDMNIYGTSTD